MIPLVKDGEMVLFLLEVTKTEDHYLDFNLYEVTSWSLKNEVMNTELYANGTIKWDGCSHITFFEDGYKHLCGRHCWQKHCDAMKKLYVFASENIKDFDASEKWDEE